MTQTPDGTLYGALSAIPNSFGSIYKLGLGSAGAPPSQTITGLTLVDPQPNFVNPGSITANPSGLISDPTMLATNGRTVVGVAADGVSRVLLRGNTSLTLTYTLLDENMNPVGPSVDYGSLIPAVGPSFGFSTSISAQPASVNGESMAFVVYKSPADFVRSDANRSSDQMAAMRTVNIQISTAGGTVLTNYKVVLVRPPVELIHGITSSPVFWQSFTPLVTACTSNGDSASSDPRFYVQCADWSKIVSGVTAIQPNYLARGSTLLQSHPVSQNVLGYAYNAQVILPQMQNTLMNYSQSSPQAMNMPIASVQVDVVGHSMGGLIARTMPYVLTASPNSYKQSANYGQGLIHKMITIGSPHLGSPLSIVALDPLNPCFWFLAAVAGEYPLQSATVAGITVSGGTADLVGDGQGQCVSPALGTLQGSADKQIPVALIAGQMSAAQLAGLSNSPQSREAGFLTSPLTSGVLALACSTDYALHDYNSTGWLTLNRTGVATQSDAIVPLTSAVDGLSQTGACSIQMNQTPAQPPCNMTFVQYAVHGAGTVTELGFPPPSLLDAITGVPFETINLLNARVSDPAFAVLPIVAVGQVGGCK